MTGNWTAEARYNEPPFLLRLQVTGEILIASLRRIVTPGCCCCCFSSVDMFCGMSTLYYQNTALFSGF